MTMLEAIRAARDAALKVRLRTDIVSTGGSALAVALFNAESEAKREAEAFERARAAWLKGGGAIWNDDREILNAYFAAGEKEG